ncbi:MAG: V-type ATP synthase subunit D [Endomicrobiia bacterium]|nr:V-type ATP synthase subunit D [Endomicrobiia bacterium]
MRLNVNPNRMELIKLRRRLVLARRGHKLLKDKRDELMRIFMEMFERVFAERAAIDEMFARIMATFRFARAAMFPGEFISATSSSDMTHKFSTSEKSLLSLRVPEYKIEIEGDPVSWSAASAPTELSEAFWGLRDFIPRLARLSSDEKTLELLAEEVERTRRRVNALEYVLMPNLVETIRYISMRLAENERSDQVRLMKIKDIVRSH